MRRHAPATQRNRLPILAVLERVIAPGSRVLELASGTGEHALFFSQQLDVQWFPTDLDPEALASIDDWAREGGDNLHPAVRLDATATDWPHGPMDVVLATNLIHISPWEATLGLLRGARRSLVSGGRLVTYGPYKRDGKHTAESNVRFEAWLHSLDPRFGVRDLERVAEEAAALGFDLDEIVPMPANNFMLVFNAP